MRMDTIVDDGTLTPISVGSVEGRPTSRTSDQSRMKMDNIFDDVNMDNIVNHSAPQPVAAPNAPVVNVRQENEVEEAKFWDPLTLNDSRLLQENQDYPAAPYIYVACLVLAKVLVAGLPIYSLSYIVNSAESDSQGDALVTVTVLLLLIFLCTVVVGVFLMFNTNAPSMSVMLSQRWNPISFLMGHFLTALCYFCCAWVGGIYVMRHKLEYSDPLWKILCSVLCFIFIALAQLFPRIQGVEPTVLGVGYEVRPVGFAMHDGNHVIPVLHPICFAQNGNLTFAVHVGLSLTGVVLALIVIINFLNDFSRPKAPNLVLSLMMVIIAGTCEIISLLGGLCAQWRLERPVQCLKNWQNLMFTCETAFVYSVVIGVVLAAMADSQMFDNYRN